MSVRIGKSWNMDNTLCLVPLEGLKTKQNKTKRERERERGDAKVSKVLNLVGDRTSACVSLTFVSILCKMAIEKVAVFPVPDCACAITSLPLVMGLIALC